MKGAMCIWLEDEAQKRSSVSDVVTEEAEQLTPTMKSLGICRRAASMAVKGGLQTGRIR